MKKDVSPLEWWETQPFARGVHPLDHFGWYPQSVANHSTVDHGHQHIVGGRGLHEDVRGVADR